ncbi:MAG: hypothetical protein ACKO5E_07275 [bacterium]
MISPIHIRFISSIAVLALMGMTTEAGSISFTGNVEKDFIKGLATDVITNGNGVPDVGQFPWMTSQGIINGWDVKDVRLAWDQPNDVLYVGLNYFGVAGDSDGNGVVGTYTQEFRNAGGVELPGIGGRSTITLGIGPYGNNSKPTVVAGIPMDKAQAGPGLNGFNVASAIPNLVMGSNYGVTLKNHIGTLYNGGPDFEFTINNFSKLPGINFTEGVGITFVSGSQMDSSIGEDSMPYYNIKPIKPIIIPEPATILAWTLGIAAMGVYSRRKAIANQ